jgi:hypothetical protein
MEAGDAPNLTETEVKKSTETWLSMSEDAKKRVTQF